MKDLYPSRTATDQYQWIQRHDPVVHGELGYMTTYQRDFYAASGYLILKGVLDTLDLKMIKDAADHILKDPMGSGSLIVKEPNSDVVRSAFGVHSQYAFGRHVNNYKFRGIVEEICGGDVYVHQSRINFKQPMQSTGWAWHSDFETWHVEDGMPAMRCVSVMICVDDNTHLNGPLMVIPGSHKKFLSCPGETANNNHVQHLAAQVVGIPDLQSLQQCIADSGGVVDALTADAGDVVLFDCNIMHGSGSNVSPWPRANFTLVFNAVENAVAEPFCGKTPRPQHVATRPSEMNGGVK